MSFIEYGNSKPVYFHKWDRKPLPDSKVLLQHENGKPFEAENKLQETDKYYIWIPAKKETECKILTVQAFVDPAPLEHFMTGGNVIATYEGDR